MMALLMQYLAPLIAIIAGLGAAFTIGHAHATAKERTRAAQQREADNEALATKQVNDARAGAAEQVKTIEGATNEQKAVNQLDVAAVTDELRANWSRD